MRDRNLCLEEYLESLRIHPIDFLVEDMEEDIDFEDLLPPA